MTPTPAYAMSPSRSTAAHDARLASASPAHATATPSLTPAREDGPKRGPVARTSAATVSASSVPISGATTLRWPLNTASMMGGFRNGSGAARYDTGSTQ